jgi:hypothetical protein
MTDLFIAAASGVAAAMILSAAAYFMAKVRAMAKKQTAIEKGVQTLLRYCIIQMFNHYTGKNHIPIYARQNVENLHVEYKALGGNGTIESLVDRLMMLPVDKPADNNGGNI